MAKTLVDKIRKYSPTKALKRNLINLAVGLSFYVGILGIQKEINADRPDLKHTSRISDVKQTSTVPSATVAYWSFDNDASESTGKSYLNGAFVGNAHIETTGQVAIPRNRGCLVLDGAPSRVNLPAPLAPLIGALPKGTIESWVYLAAVRDLSAGAIVFNSGIAGKYTDLNVGFNVSQSSYYSAMYLPDSPTFQFNMPSKFHLNEWHHIAWSWDGNTISCWIDNSLVGEHDYAQIVPFTGNSVEIGSDDQDVGYFVGKIDEVRLSNTTFDQLPPSPTPYPIEIISPRGGEIWQGKSIQQIHWKVNDLANAGTAVRFELWDNDIRKADLGYGWSDVGETTDTVVLPLMFEETTYNVRAYSLWDSDFWGKSNDFTITGKPIRFDRIIPHQNANESENIWKVGSLQSLLWEANPDIAGTGVKFELWQYNPKTKSERKIKDLKLAKQDPFYDLGLGWDPNGKDVSTITVPNVSQSFLYKVRVISIWDPSYWDESENISITHETQ